MLLDSIGRALNRGLADSSRAQARCRALEGRRLRLEIGGSPWPLLLCCGDGRLQLRRDDGTAADATVSGGAVSLLAMMGGDRRAVIQRGDVRIGGDAEIAQQFSDLADLLRPDIEAEVARLLGPIPAHLLMRGARSLAGWTRHAAEATLRNGAEYLAHESRDLVPRAEAEDLLRGIESLRERVDRAAAGLAQLEQRTQRLAQSGAESRS